MKERPILFNGEMVRAILDGRKTQTRRVIKFPRHALIGDAEAHWIKSIHRDGGGNWVAWSYDDPKLAEFTKNQYPNGEGFSCPYGQPGDRLWVRETWAFAKRYYPESDDVDLDWIGLDFYPKDGDIEQGFGVVYKASPYLHYEGKWRSARFMPKWASRIWLEITGVKAERLQDISDDDAEAEGFTYYGETLAEPIPPDKFASYWDTLNAKRGYSWEANPWVWVLDFKQSG